MLSVAGGRDEADRGLDGLDLAVAAAEDPLQHARVLAEPGPQELAVLVLAEPVDVEDLRELRRRRCVGRSSASGPCSRRGCSRRTAAARTGRSAAGRRCRRRPRSSPSSSSRRGTSPCSQSKASRTSGRTVARRPPKRNASIGTPAGSSHSGGDRRACAAGYREAGVRVRGRHVGVRRPVVAVPVDQVRGRLLRHALPPDVAVVGQRRVREDRVVRDGRRSRSGSSPRSCPGRRRRSRPRG